jgi:hypothetical protein
VSDDELKQAAERLRRAGRDGRVATYGHPDRSTDWEMDVATLAEAWLAEHPAGGSDPTPGPAPVPLTEVELRMVEQWAGSPPQDGHDRLILRLAAECRRLRAQVAGHAGRIAAQSELLGRRAEGWTAAPPAVPGWWWWRRGEDSPPEPVKVEHLHWSLNNALAVMRMDGYSGIMESFGGEWGGQLTPPA